MQELDLFFDMLRNGYDDPIGAVKEALGRRRKIIDTLQQETMHSDSECRRMIEDLCKLSKMCDKICAMDKQFDLARQV